MYERHWGGSTTKTPLRGVKGERVGGKYFLFDFLEILKVYVESNSKNFLFIGIFRFSS